MKLTFDQLMSFQLGINFVAISLHHSPEAIIDAMVPKLMDQKDADWLKETYESITRPEGENLTENR